MCKVSGTGSRHDTRNEDNTFAPGPNATKEYKSPTSQDFFVFGHGITKPTLRKWVKRSDERDGRSIPDCTRRQLETGAEVKRTLGTKSCVISDYDCAKTVYTPKNLWVQNKLREFSNSKWGNVTRVEMNEKAAEYRRQWESTSDNEKKVWECCSRCHLAQWHTILGVVSATHCQFNIPRRQ